MKIWLLACMILFAQSLCRDQIFTDTPDLLPPDYSFSSIPFTTTQLYTLEEINSLEIDMYVERNGYMYNIGFKLNHVQSTQIHDIIDGNGDAGSGC